MAEGDSGALFQVSFYLRPVALVVADPLAVGADGEPVAQRADLGQGALQSRNQPPQFRTV